VNILAPDDGTDGHWFPPGVRVFKAIESAFNFF